MKESKASSDHDERKEEKDDDGDEAIRVWDCGSPLYDSYELVSLSHVIDRHMMIFPSLNGSREAERSSRFSRAPNRVIPSFFSSAAASKEAVGPKKARGSSVLVAFLGKLVERNAWKRRICGERVDEKPKKMNINSERVYNRISSSRK